MKADDLAAYFQKKIAKPIAFDLSFSERAYGKHHFYAIEPIAVQDGVVHLTVHLKFDDLDANRKKSPVHLGEIGVPLRDGDRVESVLLMAVTGTYFKGRDIRLNQHGAVSDIEEDLQRRIDEMAGAKPAGP